MCRWIYIFGMIIVIDLLPFSQDIITIFLFTLLWLYRSILCEYNHLYIYSQWRLQRLYINHSIYLSKQMLVKSWNKFCTITQYNNYTNKLNTMIVYFSFRLIVLSIIYNKIFFSTFLSCLYINSNSLSLCKLLKWKLLLYM